MLIAIAEMKQNHQPQMMGLIEANSHGSNSS